jgi:hypothetical protein
LTVVTTIQVDSRTIRLLHHRGTGSAPPSGGRINRERGEAG